MQQNHGIQPARNRHKDPLPCFEEPALLDILFDPADERIHEPMVSRNLLERKLRIAGWCWSTVCTTRQETESYYEKGRK